VKSSRVVLLDLDGTLVDSRPGILASCDVVMRAMGHEPDPSPDLAYVIGPPIDDVMRHLLALRGDDRVSEAVAAYRAHYGAKGLYATTVYDGVRQALADLVAGGATLFVATSKRTVFARRILDLLDLSAFMSGIYGSEPGGAVDHKPELIADILRREGIAAGACIMVGDRRFDIEGAHANAMPALGVLWGYGSEAELRAVGAEGLVRQPDDLAAAVAGISFSTA
jgi:phosphoglycolate phosphatase